MATSSTLSALINGGVLGLSALFGNHTAAASAAAVPLAMIKSNLNNPAAVANNATLLANMFASTNPAAAATALAIASNPAGAAALIGTLETEISAQSTNILTSLSHAVYHTSVSLGATVPAA